MLIRMVVGSSDLHLPGFWDMDGRYHGDYLETQFRQSKSLIVKKRAGVSAKYIVLCGTLYHSLLIDQPVDVELRVTQGWYSSVGFSTRLILLDHPLSITIEPNVQGSYVWYWPVLSKLHSTTNMKVSGW